jgi:hypothetical protein
MRFFLYNICIEFFSETSRDNGEASDLGPRYHHQHRARVRPVRRSHQRPDERLGRPDVRPLQVRLSERSADRRSDRLRIRFSRRTNQIFEGEIYKIKLLT